MERTSFHVEELDTAELYKLTTGLIIPRPIGWIGTQSADGVANLCLLYTSPSPRDRQKSRMPSSA